MKRTTVMLPEGHWLELKELAQREGRSPSEVIREAVASYVIERRVGARPSFVGLGASDQGDASRCQEAYLGED